MSLVPSPTGAPPDGWYYQRVWQSYQSTSEPQADHSDRPGAALFGRPGAQAAGDGHRTQDVTVLNDLWLT